jgi:hypothetical protein
MPKGPTTKEDPDMHTGEPMQIDTPAPELG